MAQEEIEIEIGRDGKVVVRTIGIKGPACKDYAELVAQIIGRIDGRELTHEFYETSGEVRREIDVHQRR